MICKITLLGGISLASIFAYSTVFSSPSLSMPSGVWVFDGYGHVLDTRTNEPKLYDATDKTCARVAIEPKDLTAILNNTTIKYDASNGTALIYDQGDLHGKRAQRSESLPASCQTPSQNDPLSTFEAFADFVATHHGFLKLHNINWSERVSAARSHLTPTMSDEALFELFASMLEGLNDPHTSLVAVAEGEEHLFSPYESTTKQTLKNTLPDAARDMSVMRYYWFEHIGQTLLRGEGLMTESKRMQYGMLANGTGYLAILEMQHFAGKDEEDHTRNMAALHESMQEVLTYFQANQAQQIIVDVSVNLGGDDSYGRAIAGYFTNESHYAYSKSALDARNPITTRFEIKPAGSELRFTGPVYFITSGATFSAAEIFTLSMRALPNVTHVGEKTSGGLSDILSKQLPNGWTLNLSNELYLDKDNIGWESLGIAPELVKPVYLTENPFQSHLNLIEELAN